MRVGKKWGWVINIYALIDYYQISWGTIKGKLIT